MLSKVKSAGGVLTKKVTSVFEDDDANADERFKRRAQAGEVGVTMQTVLPSNLAPLSVKRDEAITQVEDALSALALNEITENPEALLRRSSIDMTKQSTNPDENVEIDSSVTGKTVSLEQFIEDNLSVKYQDLCSNDDPQPSFSGSKRAPHGSCPGFASSTDMATPVQKWKGGTYSATFLSTDQELSEKDETPNETVDLEDKDAADVKTDANNSANEELVTTTNRNNNSDKDDEEGQEKKSEEVKNVAYPEATKKESFLKQRNISVDDLASKSGEKVSYLNLKKEPGFVKGEEGLKHYRLFTVAENVVNVKRADIAKRDMIEDYRWRLYLLDDLLQVAKDYYTDPKGLNRRRWKDLRRDINQHSTYSFTDTRVKFGGVKSIFPFFTVAIIIVQIIAMSIIIGVNGGIASVSTASSLVLQDNTRTFLGTETVDTWLDVNMWVGVGPKFMTAVGSMLAVCMREDINHNMMYIAQNFSRQEPLGCCEVPARNTAATTTEQECKRFTMGVGRWKTMTCNKRLPGTNSVEHVLKPCCIDLKGTCSLLSQEHCTFLGGVFHKDNKEHCSQVNCPSDICGMGGLPSDPVKAWLPTSPYQWWRPILSLVYCHGVLHLILVVAAEWLFLRQTELSAGWLRVAIIYVLCGTAGGMCASLLSPYEPQVSSSAAVMGCIGVVHMEILEGWELLPRPRLQILKIYAILLFAIITGTLPGVSNAAILVGFITGLLSAVAILPYIHLRQWNQIMYRIVMSVAFCLIAIVFFVVIYSFYKIQAMHLCQWCRDFECVNYFKNMCTHDIAAHFEQE